MSEKTAKATLQNRRILIESAFEGVDLKRLAAGLKTTVGALYNIKYATRAASAKRAIEIDRLTNGRISKKVLRPDIFF